MSRVIAVSARKGGVGKSTTAFQLAAESHRRGLQVLAVDADLQADLTRYTGPALTHPGLEAIFASPPSSLDPRPYIRPFRPGFDVLGCTAALEAVDEKIIEGLDEGPFYLRAALECIAAEYDVVIIDVGHSPQLITNIMAVTDVLVTPVVANFPDANHAGDMIDLAARIRTSLHLAKVDMIKRSVISIWRRAHNGASDAHVIAHLLARYEEQMAKGDDDTPLIIPNSVHVTEANWSQMSVREFHQRYGNRRDRALATVV